MFSKTLLISILVAFAEARFGQEQTPIQAIAQVTSGGGPGVASTIAGGAISNLLAATNPCDKLKTADNIIAQLGTGADALAAAIGMVAAEKNFNPFAVSIPSICSDPTLPTTLALRGITPLIDPAVGGSDVANKLSAASVLKPFDATGLSVAQVLAAQGFTNFTTLDTAGKAGKGSDLAAGAAPIAGAATDIAAATSAAEAASSTDAAAASSTTEAAAVATDAATGSDCAPDVTVTVTAGAAATSAAAVETSVAAVETSAAAAETSAAASATDAAAPAATSAAAASGDVQKSTIAGLDFGLCVPTMKFEAGINGRKATEFTFLPIDPLVAQGQQEALNPAIIANRICDQLINVCKANDAAHQACLAQKPNVVDKVAKTAEDWNTALGFAGTNIAPDATRRRSVEGLRRRAARV